MLEGLIDRERRLHEQCVLVSVREVLAKIDELSDWGVIEYARLPYKPKALWRRFIFASDPIFAPSHVEGAVIDGILYRGVITHRVSDYGIRKDHQLYVYPILGDVALTPHIVYTRPQLIRALERIEAS